MTYFVSEKPVVGVLILGSVFKVKEKITTNGYISVVPGLGFIWAPKIIDISTDI
ncbi:hypothetical protein FRC0119_00293 [Corynebacterium diphtheriae]|nr:hypothetical protein FRC0119_00293 [Corynebacterium diphtheriae]